MLCCPLLAEDIAIFPTPQPSLGALLCFELPTKQMNCLANGFCLGAAALLPRSGWFIESAMTLEKITIEPRKRKPLVFEDADNGPHQHGSRGVLRG